MYKKFLVVKERSRGIENMKYNLGTRITVSHTILPFSSGWIRGTFSIYASTTKYTFDSVCFIIFHNFLRKSAILCSFVRVWFIIIGRIFIALSWNSFKFKFDALSFSTSKWYYLK